MCGGVACASYPPMTFLMLITAEPLDSNTIQPYAAVAEHLGPAPRLAAEKGVEFGWRRSHWADAGLIQAVDHGRIRIDRDLLLKEFVDHRLRRAGRRHEPDPARHIVELRQACRNGERFEVRQLRQRATVELGKRTKLPALDQRQTR